MKFACSVSGAVLFAVCLSGNACSQQRMVFPKPLVDAQQFLEKAPAYQVKTVTRNLQSRSEEIEERQVMRDGPLRYRMIDPDGRVQVDLITDGHREFLPDERGKFVEMQGDAAAALAEQRQRASLAFILEGNREARFAGNESLNGAMAAIYETAIGRGTIMPGTIRVWIAESDHRPLQMVMELRAVNPKDGTNRIIQIDTSVYGYDPAIEVKMPK